MSRVFLADNHPTERSALRLFLMDLQMQIVGEAEDWLTTLAQAPATTPAILLVAWALLPNKPSLALQKLRQACPAAMVVVLFSDLDAQRQAALSSGADYFISKWDRPDKVAAQLRIAAAAVDRQTPIDKH
ncbi:MAG: response regulator [Chloroflexi bacterium]|nr:response regulator [Chloroflexota bacterium]